MSLELAACVRAGEPRAGTTRVVLIDGRSGSGKTALATRLAAALGAPVVELEYLYGGWDGLERGCQLLESAVLAPLSAAEPVRVPRYDWETDRWIEPEVISPPDVLVIEGAGAGTRGASRYASLLVWVELADAVRKERALARDRDLYRPHWERWAVQEDALFAREQTRARADVIVDTSGLEPVITARRADCVSARATDELGGEETSA